jgi:hypothetical protein
MHSWLRVPKDEAGHVTGAPLLTIDVSCAYLRRTIPAQRSSKNDPDDVDCWVAGTLVSTPHGPVPIEAINPGDIVETPVGPRPVTESYLSGTSATMWLRLADGRRLEGTPYHKVYVKGKGLIPLESIACHDILMEKIIWSKWLNIAVSCIAAIRGGSITARAGACWGTVAQACIGRFGWTPAERFRPSGTSITSTATMTIMPWRTWPASPRQSMLLTTVERVWPVSLDNGSRRGVSRSLDGPFSERMPTKCSRERLNGNARALIVACLLRRDTLSKSFARIAVKSWAIIPFGIRARCAVLSVKLSGRRIDRCKPARIVAVGHCADRKRVYNITVQDARLFYANGILSSNTTGDDHGVDALRYLLMSRPSPTQLRAKMDPPPKGSAGALLAELRAGVGQATVLGAGNVR